MFSTFLEIFFLILTVILLKLVKIYVKGILKTSDLYKIPAAWLIEKDGWKRINGMPDGWHYKEKLLPDKTDSRMQKQFLSEKGHRLKSPRDALKYLLANNYAQNIVDEFRKTFNPTLGKTSEDTLKNTLNIKDEIKVAITRDAIQMKTRPEPKKILTKVDNKSVPIKYKYVEKDFLPQGCTTNGRYYRSSDGQTLKTLHEKVKAMKSKGYSETEIDQVKMNGFKIRFMKKSSLPVGWMCAKGQSGDMKGGNVIGTKFLSPDGHIFWRNVERRHEEFN